MKSKNKFYSILAILLLLVAISSSIVGYILGQRSAPAKDGAIIDTIILQPEKQVDSVPLSLSGVICYTDGKPYANQKLQLHSTPRTATTDSKGRFMFYDVEPGDHIIKVMNDTGHIAAQVGMILKYTQFDDTQLINTNDGKYQLSVPENVLLVETEIQLDTANGTLALNPGRLTTVAQNGFVTTPAGSVLAAQSGVILTPQGACVYPDGNITSSVYGAILNDGSYIAPDGKVTLSNGSSTAVAPDKTVIFPNGVSIAPDKTTIALPNGTKIDLATGKTILSNGTVIVDGTVTFPDGSTAEPGDSNAYDGGYIVSDTLKPIGGGTAPKPDVVNPPVTSTPSVTHESQVTSEPSTTPDDDDDDDDGGGGTTPPSGSVSVTEGGVSWAQLSTINLFTANNSGHSDKKLYPGVEGYYNFGVANTQSFDIGFHLTLSEAEADAIPFEYRLKSAGKYINNDDTWRSAASFDSVFFTVAKESSVPYTLEWRWPYESGNDALDTHIGAVGTNHTVKIVFRVEQIV